VGNISIIKIKLDSEKTHQRFEWRSGEYKKLFSVFCSPDVQFSLVFNSGKKILLRGFEYQKSKDTAPNNRSLRVKKDLNNEVISGIISRIGNNKRQLAVYLIVEK
jgi:hypothetical protein